MNNTKKEKALAEIVEAFKTLDFDDIPSLVQRGLDAELDPEIILNDGLIFGLREVGGQFQRGEAFLPELMLSAEGYETAMEILKPLMVKSSSASKGKIILGTVKDDIHNLGKNIVANLLKTDGFDVIDLGVNVPSSEFVAKAIEYKADIIALSALMTTTMPRQKEVIDHLDASGKRADYYVMIGGASANKEWSDEINSDAYGETAWDAVTIANKFMAEKEAK